MLCSALRPKIKIRCSNPMASIVLSWCDVMINDWYYQDFKIQKDSSQHITAALNNFNIPQSGLSSIIKAAYLCGVSCMISEQMAIVMKVYTYGI